MLDNKPHGEGKEVNAHYEFEGIYRNGKKTQGKLTWNQSLKCKIIYEGSLMEECFHGKGKLITKEGEYEGEFQNGRKEGKGKMKYCNGTTYDGEFPRNCAHGRGELYDSEGESIQTGTWEHGKFQESATRP